MIKILLYIKHKLKFLWQFAEWLNGFFFGLQYEKKIKDSVSNIVKSLNTQPYIYKLIDKEDINELHNFFISQPENTYKYFKPHEFDVDTLNRLYKNKSFFMFGVFDSTKIVGYFMLRFFINKQAFAGFLVDVNHQGQGIAKNMGRIMFKLCWNSGFRVFATVSKENKAALSSYKSINDFKIIRELPDNYIYIEYTKEGEKK